MIILKYILESIAAYLIFGFLLASFIAKFEVPTNYDTRNSLWCRNAEGFTIVWLVWVFVGTYAICEQIVVRIARLDSTIERYLQWLKKEPNRIKKQEISA